LGASSWWPCKDYQGDEPEGMSMEYGGKVSGTIISNGHLYPFKDSIFQEDPVTGETKVIPRDTGERWIIPNPINTYNATFYIGDYAHWHDTLHGEKGVLDLDFYPLRYNETKARKQWRQAKEMLRCFEWWMGPYPFYEDGYKLVEAPFLGMEHQSAIAYGNQYKNGYNGRGIHTDRSGTGVGFGFDFIIIHESGHEWFGNNITARDIADNWLHEGFTTYTEALYAEWTQGKEKAFAYTMGEWKNIRNDKPVIGDYGVNDDGSSDKYDKGSAVVHMVRMLIDDDKKFRELLRGLNKDYYHKIVTTQEVEDYISRFVGIDLKPFFDQYLRTNQKPELLWSVKNGVMHYEWKNSVPGFFAPFILQSKKSRTLIKDKNAAGPERGFSSEKGKKAKWDVEACGWYDVVKE
jgi:aminopeptidase N